MFHLYDRNMDHIDLKSNPRLSNFDSIYVPRISTGYALGAAGYYPKRYWTKGKWEIRSLLGKESSKIGSIFVVLSIFCFLYEINTN